MDALPPNDPNHHNNDHNKNSAIPKNVGSTRDGQMSTHNRPRLNERGEMDVFLGGGNLGDDIMVATMVFVGAVAWILREVCVCR